MQFHSLKSLLILLRWFVVKLLETVELLSKGDRMVEYTKIPGSRMDSLLAKRQLILKSYNGFKPHTFQGFILKGV